MGTNSCEAMLELKVRFNHALSIALLSVEKLFNDTGLRRDASPLLHRRLSASFAWIIFALVASGMLAFVVSFSDPVLVQDGWYFLDVFLSKVADGSLHLGDFFVNRGGLDHPQPWNKLVLLFEWRYFNLDFRIQAMIGLFFAAGTLLLARYLIFWKDRQDSGWLSWVWAGMCVSLISLNSTGIWTWPLVTIGFTSTFLLYATMVATWKYLDSGWLPLLVVVAVILDIVAGNVAVLMTIALLLALSFVYIKMHDLRTRAIRAGIVLVACWAVVHIGYLLIYTSPTVHTMPFGSRVNALLHAFANGGWWQWIIVPLSSSVAYRMRLERIVGDDALAIQIALGLILVACHVWFWRRAFKSKPNSAYFAAIAIMLTFYAFLAAIVYARVPMFNNDYLNQPRYVMTYNMGNMALLLMCASHLRVVTVSRRFRAALIAVIAAVVLWQIPITVQGWRAGPYIAHYEQNMANQIWYMADHKYDVPKGCAPELFVCKYPRDQRAKLIGLLQTNNKNVFSEAFRRATRIRRPNTL